MDPTWKNGLAVMRGPGNELADALALAARFTSGKKDYRPVLQAVLLDEFERRMRVVATDTYRMVVITLEEHKALTYGTKFPRRQVLLTGAKALAKELRRQTEDVTWNLEDERTLVGTTGEGDAYRAGLESGEFPDWAALLVRKEEDEDAARLAWDPEEVLDICKEAIAGGSAFLRLDADPDDGVTFRWRVSENVQEPYEVQRELRSALYWPGTERQLVNQINPKFLRDALGNCELAEIAPVRTKRPWRFPNGTTLALVMPFVPPNSDMAYRAPGEVITDTKVEVR